MCISSALFLGLESGIQTVSNFSKGMQYESWHFDNAVSDIEVMAVKTEFIVEDKFQIG